MKCPVCDNVNTSLVCLRCGFDGSTNYEKYPTFGAVGKVPTVSALREQWRENPPPPEPEKQPWKGRIWLVAAACALAMGLGIWIGTGMGKAEPAEPIESIQMQEPVETTTAPPETSAYAETTAPQEPWRMKVLRGDPPLDENDGVIHYGGDYAQQLPVFGSDYRRDQISSVTFLDTRRNRPMDNTWWDVSLYGDGSVSAWVKPNGELYDLYIAAEGGISAGKYCDGMFCGYSNATHITFGNAFHTENVGNMRSMFVGCSSLVELTLGDGFDTSNVYTMEGMFYGCSSLKKLTLGDGFDTSNVQNMWGMFNGCSSLKKLTLGDGFDTSNVQDMREMFYDCASLTELTLGDSFVTTNAMTGHMFTNCPAGADYQHLLH